MNLRWGGLAMTAACVLTAARAAGERAGGGVAAASHVDDGQAGSTFDRPHVVRELMRRRGGDPAAAAQLVQLCRGFDPAVAAACFEELAHAHQAAGDINLAADARLLFVQTHAGAPEARDAQLWLTRLYASSEVSHMHRPAGTAASDDVDQGLAMYGYSLAGGDTGAKDPMSDPELTFARAVAARRAGLTKPAAAQLSPLKHQRPGDPWGDCARAEAWLAESRESPPPKPVARCAPAAARPTLDGKLDDPCWHGAVAVELGTAATRPGLVRVAYDGEFLYLGVTCAKLDGVDYARDDAPRPHDGDLSRHDRVTVVLDADRDYATGFELTIDSRAWTGDRCWGDAAWNPDWYVAGGEDDLPTGAAWTAEAAIPWKALAIRAPRAGEAWACSVFREAPGVDTQRWSGDASSATGPTAFGLLRFE